MTQPLVRSGVSRTAAPADGRGAAQPGVRVRGRRRVRQGCAGSPAGFPRAQRIGAGSELELVGRVPVCARDGRRLRARRASAGRRSAGRRRVEPRVRSRQQRGRPDVADYHRRAEREGQPRDGAALHVCHQLPYAPGEYVGTRVSQRLYGIDQCNAKTSPPPSSELQLPIRVGAIPADLVGRTAYDAQACEGHLRRRLRLVAQRVGYERRHARPTAPRGHGLDRLRRRRPSARHLEGRDGHDPLFRERGVQVRQPSVVGLRQQRLRRRADGPVGRDGLAGPGSAHIVRARARCASTSAPRSPPSASSCSSTTTDGATFASSYWLDTIAFGMEYGPKDANPYGDGTGQFLLEPQQVLPAGRYCGRHRVLLKAARRPSRSRSVAVGLSARLDFRLRNRRDAADPAVGHGVHRGELAGSRESGDGEPAEQREHERTDEADGRGSSARAGASGESAVTRSGRGTRGRARAAPGCSTARRSGRKRRRSPARR